MKLKQRKSLKSMKPHTKAALSMAVALVFSFGAAGYAAAGDDDNVQKAENDSREPGAKTIDKNGTHWTLARARNGYGESNIYFSPDDGGTGGDYDTELECPCKNNPGL